MITRTLSRTPLQMGPMMSAYRHFCASSFLATPLLLVFFLHVTFSQNSYSKSTNEVFNSTPTGYPAALWDVNQDRLTDVIIWKKGDAGDKIEIFESQTNLQQKHPVLKLSDTTVTLPKGRSIVSVIPGDFDGDMVLDLVIVTTPNTPTADSYRLYVSWGSSRGAAGHWKLDTAAAFPGSDDKSSDLLRQPTVLDFDGNTVPDLLVQEKDSLRRLFVNSLGPNSPRKWNMVAWNELTNLKYSLTPHSNAFVDINQDLMADLCLSMKDTDGNHFLVVATHNEFVQNDYPDEMPFKELTIIGLNSTNVGEFKEMGQISFVDFNNNQSVNALIPVTYANGTTSLWLFDWATNYFKDVTPDWHGYKLLEADNQIGVPLRIHLGDFDQDGYTDGLAIVTKENERKVVLLKNEPVSSAAEASDKDRKFSWDPTKTDSLENVDGILEMASFFDAYDDGLLDILVVSSKDKTLRVDCFQNNLGIDATWIKAMVYTGFCGDLTGFPPCHPDAKANLALSLPVVGATVNMNTIRGDGHQQAVAAGLLTQLTHFSLQMPTTIFGLGRSPNFVDKIAVGLPPVLNNTAGNTHIKVFEQTIPNSAVVINPRPLNQPNSWRAFIYVTPSSAMLETGIVLSVVFALLAILVGLLHLKEKREDQKEKLVEMQRFHFDAM